MSIHIDMYGLLPIANRLLPNVLANHAITYIFQVSSIYAEALFLDFLGLHQFPESPS